MPITHIHAITTTVGNAVEYGASDKTEIRSEGEIKKGLAYSRNDSTGEVTFKTLTSTFNCQRGDTSDGVTKDFMELINRFHKNENTKSRKLNVEEKKEPLAWHLVQSFDGYVPPLLANQIGRELAEQFLGEGWRVQISTHTNTENIHNHIIFCAWNENGKKYNGSNTNYNRLREISDRICEGYGIQILENTRRMKLVKWTDKEGRTHYYEPTDRKNELIEQRKAGKISLDDVSSYCNSESYLDFVRGLKSNREIVQHDIDMYLPFAMNYEHLLSLLREHCGYEIKDKKKNGDWREHITFIPPTAERGIRDNGIGDGVFYTRENLESYISEQENNRSEHQGEQANKGINKNETSHGEVQAKIPVFSNYSYSETDVKMLDERLRAVVKENGEIGYIRRGRAEKTLIREIKKKDNELYTALYKVGFDSSTIDEIIKRQQEQKGMKRLELKREQEEYAVRMVEKIQQRLNVLEFMERNSIHTYEQLNTIVQSMWEKYNQCFSKANEAEMGISQLEGLLTIKSRLVSLQERMRNGRTNRDYVLNELPIDKKTEQKYLYLIGKYKLNDPQEVREIMDKIEKTKATINSLKTAMERYKLQLSNYENCVDVLRESDKAGERAFAEAWRNYDEIERAGKSEEQNNENRRKQRKGLER